MKPGFYTVELVSIRLLSSFFVMIKKNDKVSTTWEVPERYLNLSPVGSGAFGQVIIAIMIIISIIIIINSVIIRMMITYDRYVQRRTQSGEARTVEM